jgi:hypothetical protein
VVDLDPYGHRLWVDEGPDVSLLARVIERELRAEFGVQLDQAEIERLGMEALERFGDARIRTFIPILATRAARSLALTRLAHGART